MNLLLGAHRATSGGRHKAFDSGMAIGCRVIQIFTASPRQWASSPIAEADLAKWHAARAESSVELVVAHDSYLINLAAPDEDLRAKSAAAFSEELVRADALAIPYLVSHPGASVDGDEAAALERFAVTLRGIYEARPELRCVTLLETTAGMGTSLGWRLEQLAWLLERIDLPDRVAVCGDTCHLFAAGYDLRTPEAYAAVAAELDSTVGRERVKLWHLNDSKRELGSRVDRHEQIGAGELGDEAFAQLLRDPRWQGVPMLVETPDLDLHGDNLRRLRRLARSGRGGAA